MSRRIDTRGPYWTIVLLTASIGAGIITYHISNHYGMSRAYRNSTAQATILLELTNSYVSSYSAIRQTSNENDLPVPATFRADSLAHFEKHSTSQTLVKTSMVGLPGREITTAASDDNMREQLLDMERSPNPEVVTSTIVLQSNTIHRTLFPSFASSQGCVNCHNKIQRDLLDKPWQKGDLLGAYLVDRYIDPQLAQIRQISLLLSILAAFLVLTILLSVKYFIVQRQLARQLRHLATTDALTGCINRREMYTRIQYAADNTSGSLLMIDLDNFKDINDKYGHATGDLVLRDFSRRIHDSLRAEDWVARVGGEEFVVWLPDISLTDAQSVAERLRIQTEAASISAGDATVAYTASIGLQYVQNRHPSHFERWLNAADALLYRAKSEGRNRVIWSDSLQG
ncbi:MAG: GGDEF domain-containing protein [Pseudomonadota bacterium]